MSDSPKFEISPDPYASWFQLNFESPMNCLDLKAGLSHLIIDESVTLDRNRRYHSSAALREVGVEHLEVFGRKW